MATETHNPAVSVVHVRFAGRSVDLALSALDVGPASSDVQIKRVLSEQLGVNVARLAEYVIDRHANGNLTVRPAAVFG